MNEKIYSVRISAINEMTKGISTLEQEIYPTLATARERLLSVWNNPPCNGFISLRELCIDRTCGCRYVILRTIDQRQLDRI